MKKIKFAKFLVSVLFIFSLIITIQKFGVMELEASSRSDMSRWIDELKKDQQFNQLDYSVIKDNTEQYSLTSTHTMLTFPVSIQYKAYIILTTDSSNQEKIVEYGIGNYLPYQKDVIINQDVRQLNPKSFHYLSAIESFWNYDMNNERVYIEGSSGEWLPDFNEKALTPFSSQTITYQDNITDSYTEKKLSFNVTDDLSWLENSTTHKNLSSEEILSFLKDKKKLMLVGSKYKNSVTFAYSIIGYHRWNTNQVYLAIYDDELDLIRFVSLSDLNHYGQVIVP